jgi:hypothetical protein
VKRCQLPPGFVGLLLSVEIAAYTSTLSALINWGGSFVINDLYRPLYPNASVRQEVWVSRMTTLLLFVAASVVALLYVNEMVGWFMFINSAMVIFLLPLSFFRFFWWRFNVWGELAAVVLGLPISIFVWFGLDFQNTDVHPMWHGLGLLFGLSFLVLLGVTLVTPAESPETLKRFYDRCRPPGLWGPVMGEQGVDALAAKSMPRLLADSAIGIAACLAFVVATNALFVSSWATTLVSATAALGLSAALVVRVLKAPTPPELISAVSATTSAPEASPALTQA